ncbi:PQQ-binding-like beta-propeller repeat protein [Aeoliella sp.]|uniref:outer membrane protein assembly factor BamB family protein n=1 Tax=Aeoliella sp. TaxID=2795800 RepID=UPI003CCBCA64
MKFTMLSVSALFLAAMTTSVANDWRGFRGPEGSSATSTDAQPPDSFDIETGENVTWQAKLPGRGVSGPVVAGGKVLVTASSGVNRDRLHVVAIDDESGEQLWHRQFWATGRTLCHPSSANAAPTPATDGERVFAFYSSNDLACFDLDGNMQWFRGLVLDHPGLGNDVGMASSPVVAGDVVVVQCDCQANSFAAAYDCKTGEERWSIQRPASANWASPVAMDVVVEGQKVPAVLFQSREGLVAHAADDGRQLWKYGMSCSAIPSASGGDGVVYVPGGGGLSAIATSADHEGERRLWNDSSLKCGNASPIVSRAGLLVLSSAGVLNCVSPDDQEPIWRKKRLGGRFWATPVVAGERLYALSDAGEVIIVDISQGEVLNKCTLGQDQETLGSPAVAGGALYLRSHDFVWKIAAE